MVETATKLPIKTDDRKAAAPAPANWHPFDDLRREIDRVFQDFGSGWLRPLRPSAFEPLLQGVMGSPVVDIAEKPNAFEITAELPGIEAKDVEVTLRNGTIVISGEKHAEKEEKTKDYYVQERQYGSFKRSFAVPAGVDAAKVDAAFKNGILTVTLPKTVEAQKPEKKIAIKAA